jgi:DNA helicase HerA-like ATPase
MSTDLRLGGILDPQTQQPGEKLTIDSGDLCTHGVIVGMTGSGKTGLGVVLLEEVLAKGIPALIIDPKGDMEIWPSPFRICPRNPSAPGPRPKKPAVKA